MRPYCCSFVRHWAAGGIQSGVLMVWSMGADSRFSTPTKQEWWIQNDVHGSAIEMVMQARFDWDAIDQEFKGVHVVSG